MESAVNPFSNTSTKVNTISGMDIPGTNSTKSITKAKVNKKTSPYLLGGASIGALMAFSKGLVNPALNSCKQFAIVDMGWCANSPNIYDCHKSHLYTGLCLAATFTGSAIGSLFIGLTGKVGRRRSIMIINWFFITASILSASAVNFGMLFTGRLLAGVGMGLEGMIPLFLIEICHPNSRNFFPFIQPFFLIFAELLTTLWQLLHMRIVENFDKDGNPFTLSTLDKFVWRGSQFLPALTSVAALLLVHFVFTFDTPYELIEKGKTDEARIVIEKLHGTDAVDYVYDVIDLDCGIAKSTPNIPLSRALKNSKYRKIIFHTFVLAGLHQFTGISIFTSNSTQLFMQMMGRSMKTVVASSGIFLINFLAVLILFCTLTGVGRKSIMAGGICFSTLSMALASMSKPIGKEAKWVPIVSLIGSFGFVFSYMIGLGSTFWVYLSEVYPPECKNGAMSGAVFLVNISAALTIFSSEFLISYSEVLLNTLLFSISLFGLVYVMLFIRETKGVPLGKAYD